MQTIDRPYATVNHDAARQFTQATGKNIGAQVGVLIGGVLSGELPES